MIIILVKKIISNLATFSGIGVLVCTFHFWTAAQNSDNKSDKTSAVGLVKIIKNEGWIVPQIADLSLKYTSQENLDNVAVEKRSYNPQKDILLTLDWYFLKEDNVLSVRSFNLQISSVYSYGVKGKYLHSP